MRTYLRPLALAVALSILAACGTSPTASTRTPAVRHNVVTPSDTTTAGQTSGTTGAAPIVYPDQDGVCPTGYTLQRDGTCRSGILGGGGG